MADLCRPKGTLRTYKKPQPLNTVFGHSLFRVLPSPTWQFPPQPSREERARSGSAAEAPLLALPPPRDRPSGATPLPTSRRGHSRPAGTRRRFAPLVPPERGAPRPEETAPGGHRHCRAEELRTLRRPKLRKAPRASHQPLPRPPAPPQPPPGTHSHPVSSTSCKVRVLPPPPLNGWGRP